MRKFVKKLWHRTKARGEVIGFTFLILGWLSILIQFILVLIGLRAESSLLGVALGLISVGLGFIAVGMGAKSDERMEAMADAQFDQALSALVDYVEPDATWIDKYYPARGASRLAQWASAERKSELKSTLRQAKRQAQQTNDQGLVSAIEQLWCQYGIDKWPDADSVANTL